MNTEGSTASDPLAPSLFVAHFHEGPWDGHRQMIQGTRGTDQSPQMVAIASNEALDFYECTNVSPLADGTQSLDFHFRRTDQLYSEKHLYITHLGHSTL